MKWLKRIGIGLGVVAAIIVALFAALLIFGPERKPIITATFGDKKVTVSGRYDSMTQETTSDGVNAVIDGHRILINETGVVVDGERRDIDEFEELDIRLRGDDVDLRVVR